MEIILAIFVTGLGILGGVYFIWKGQNSSSPSKAQHRSSLRAQVKARYPGKHRWDRVRRQCGDKEPSLGGIQQS